MIGNLFTVAATEPAVLRAALAGLLAVPEEAVDVAETDGDQEGRDWEAPVLCTYRRLPPGDLSLELDVTVEERIAGRLTEGVLAQRLAVSTGGSVLYPSEIELPSAYWVAVPDGRSVRCRLEAVDHGDDTGYRVGAVEERVEDLPGASVEILPEILDRQHIDTPVADAFLSGYPTGTTATVEGHVHYALRVWERLARRLESDWLPSGRYRHDLFRRDLEARDDLADALAVVSAPHAEELRTAVAQLDAVFAEHTEDDADGKTGEKADGWWWHRRPRSIPW
ncbi:hypothetical protein [Streptomyces sp. MK5]|uniref:hypothetical protein n=1 Tax=Streptomyces sp. MK5 TaxID=3064253 RepID=UPI002741E827|nr:hypothetical protein [Streptomyces sp. MK5]